MLMEEDDERRTRGPDRDWIKRRREKGAFQNIVRVSGLRWAWTT